MKLKQINGVVIDLSDVPGFSDLFDANRGEAILNEVNGDYYQRCTTGGEIALDVGANLGWISLYLAPAFKTLYAVEPSPECCAMIKAICSAKGISNIIVCQEAIVAKDGDTTIHTFPGDTMRNSIYKYNEPGCTGSFKIKGSTLSSFMAARGIESVDFLKMDIEGAEMDIIMGEDFNLAGNKIKAIYVEIHEFFSGDYRNILQFSQTIQNRLRERGFTVSHFAAPYFTLGIRK